MSLSTEEQEKIQKDRAQVIKKVEGEALSPEARKLLENNKKKLAAQQTSNKLSKKNMQVYINLDENTQNDAHKDNKTENKTDKPKNQERVIKLQTNIPEDEDFGL